MKNTLVSVICLCHNQAQFVYESLLSVVNQSYPNIELIIVDDASTDGSVLEILRFVEANHNARFVPLAENVGNCKAFNIGWRISTGAYIIDLAADDVMHPDRIGEQLEEFNKLNDSYGVVYSDAFYMDSNGVITGVHSQRYPAPIGDIYLDLIKSYFICPPTIMIRREVLEELKGYDETLLYEDFDFWIRSSRRWRYSYVEKKLTYKRLVYNSLGSRFYQKKNPIHWSTFRVLEKLQKLNRSDSENKALISRILIETRLALFTEIFEVVSAYNTLFLDLAIHAPFISAIQMKLWSNLAKRRIKLYWLYKAIVRYRK